MSNRPLYNINCRPFHYKEELPAQRELFLDCFPENTGMPITTTPYYMWKFQSFPTNLCHSYEYVAMKDDEEMVGYYAAIPYQYQIDGHVYNVGMVCDVMTSSKYRGAGIFTKLGAYSTDAFDQEGLAFSTGYPIRKAPLPGHMKVGWKVMFDMPLYMRFLSLSSLLKNRGLGWARFVANPILSTYNLLLWKPNNKSVTIREFSQIEMVTDYLTFEEAWRAEQKIALVKSLDFMKWRLNAPGKEYKYICAYKGNQLVGLAILITIVKEGVPSYGMVDFMVLDQHRDCLNTIHNAIKRLAILNGKEAIMTMMSRPSQRKYKMCRNGFLRSPFIFHFITKKYDEAIGNELLANVKNWELRFIDSDDL